jgi:hypothetical protein
VFISVLSLNASHLASTETEIDLAIWLASCDQVVVESKVVSFDISEMTWSADSFEADKMFLLRVIELSMSKHYWNMLDYAPHEQWTEDLLARFRDLIKEFTKEFTRSDIDFNEPAFKPLKRENARNTIFIFIGQVV